jgi:hypothetical protein
MCHHTLKTISIQTSKLVVFFINDNEYISNAEYKLMFLFLLKTSCFS